MTNKKIKPVTLEDLSRKLGVSKVTISKALRDHPDISAATRSRVKALAEKMGYMPNYLARNLSSRKSNTIGLVVPKIAHLFFGSVIESVYDRAFEKNYETVITVSQESAEREIKHIMSLLSMRVDGLIVSITQETKDVSIFKRALRLNVPIVFIDRVPELDDVPKITVDDKGGSFSAVENFIQNGITKIGHIGGYQYINIGKERYLGFTEAMKKYGIKVKKEWITFGGFGEEDGYEGFMKFYNNADLPEAILTVTYPVAIGVYEAALEKGIRIPNDLIVTCFGNNTYKKTIPSVFSFVEQPTQELGRKAVDLMINLIDHPEEYKSIDIELKTKLVTNDLTQQVQLML